MKFNSTVALTLILLAMMFGSGFVSAMWGFAAGHEALKGVTQPDVRPTSKLKSAKRPSGGKEGLEFLREEDILKDVYAQTNKKGRNSKSEKSQQAQKNSSESTKAKKPTDEPSPAAKANNTQQNLSIKSQDKGVALVVRSVSQQGDSLLLNVSLKNESSNSVRFLYSFLNVSDDKGRALSAVTEGLPGELPSNSEEFSGTISIPTALLNDAQKLSLTLTDYPDQKLQLKLNDIPVVR